MTYDEQLKFLARVNATMCEQIAREERESRQHAPGVKPDPTTHDAVRKLVRELAKDRPKTIGRAV